jgi:hypothetical protein
LRPQEQPKMASLFRSGHKAMSQRNGYGLDQPAGVGIVFKSGPDEALFVKVCVGSVLPRSTGCCGRSFEAACLWWSGPGGQWPGGSVRQDSSQRLPTEVRLSPCSCCPQTSTSLHPSAASCMLALDLVPNAHVAGICYRVDGEDVYRQPIEKVIKYILGLEVS